MSETPDVEEIIRAAAAIGLSLGRDQALAYHERLVLNLTAIEEFMSADLQEDRPSLLSPSRDPGHRPSPSEDPFNAWLWKCSIQGAKSGLLAGRTVSFKDHIAVAGLPMTLGSALLADYLADFDATIVARVLAAGGTIVGKNSMSGPTSGWGYGVPGDYPRPLNPHNPVHLTGGSSSGSAAAVAAGEVDIAFGGDQGGSIRDPAALCGTYGLKPTFGLISHFGIGYGSDMTIDHTGPMALNAAALAATLDAVAGYDRLDPRQDRSVPLGTTAVDTLSAGVDGLRIGLLEQGFLDAEPEVGDAVTAAVDVLRGLGAKVSKVSVPEHRNARAAMSALEIEGARAVFDVGFLGAFSKTYYPRSLIASAYELFHQHTDQLTAKRKLTLITAEFTRRRYRATAYAKAQNVRTAFKRAFDEALTQVDVLAMPTYLRLAAKYVEPSDAPDAAFPRDLPENTSAYNFTGHPALSVPCGKSKGLPIGMQLVGSYYADPLLLRTAYAFETSVDWDDLIRLPARSRH